MKDMMELSEIESSADLGDDLQDFVQRKRGGGAQARAKRYAVDDRRDIVGSPSTVPNASSGTMFGWSNWAALVMAERNRAADVLVAFSSRNALMTTRRPVFHSSATYTSSAAPELNVDFNR